MISREEFYNFYKEGYNRLKIDKESKNERLYMKDVSNMVYDIIQKEFEKYKKEFKKSRKEINPKKRKLTIKQLEYLKDLRINKKLSRNKIITLYNEKYTNSQISDNRLRKLEESEFSYDKQ